MKKILITGASSGIGLASAQLFHTQDYAVTGIARKFTDNAQTWMRCLRVDLSDLNGLSHELKQSASLLDNYDVVLLNAGYGRFGSLEQFSEADITHLITTNLTSNLFLLRHFISRFKTAGGGQDIVIIGSEAGLKGARYGAVYCASKFALRGLAQSLKAECANSGIRVILINPAAVDTPFFDALNFRPAEGKEFALSPQSIAETILHTVQSPRNTVIEEVNIQTVKTVFNKKPSC